MFEKFYAAWPTIKHLRRHPAPEVWVRVRTYLHQLMRMRKTPDDPNLHREAKETLTEIHDELRKVAH